MTESTYRLLIPDGLNFFVKLFKTHEKISPSVIYWDSLTQTILKRSAAGNRSYIWYITTFVVCGILGFGSCLTVAINCRDDKISPSLLVLSMALGTFSILYWLSAIVLLKNAKDLVTGLGHMKHLHHRLCKRPCGNCKISLKCFARKFMYV